MDNLNSTNYSFVYDYKTDKRLKYRALIVLLSSIVVFSFSAFGLFDFLSTQTSALLQKYLGYTNKWSTSFGPEWFVGLNKDVSALGGFLVLLIFFTITITYFYLRRDSVRLWRFAFIVLMGAFIMLTTKMITANELIDDHSEIIIGTVSSFPSGHTMMGTIFYLTLAVTISRRQHTEKTKRLTIISAIVIITLIGISRILPGIHTLTEVVAGWSLGLAWLCLCWFLERYIKKARDKQKTTQQLSPINT